MIVLLIASMVLSGCSEEKDNSEAMSNTEIKDEDESGEYTSNIVGKETTIDPFIIEQIITDFEKSFGDIEVDKDTMKILLKPL